MANISNGCRLTVNAKRTEIVVYTPHNWDGLGKLRAIPDGRWDKTRQAQVFPVNRAIGTALWRLLPGTVAHWSNDLIDALKALPTPKKLADVVLPKELVGDFQIYAGAPKLFEYQKIGVAFCLANMRVLIADEMGLGKSAQALIAVELSKSKRVLIVCQRFLMSNWYAEIRKWTGSDDAIIFGADSPLRESSTAVLEKLVEKSKYCIVNYEMLIKSQALADVPWDAMIVDECFPGNVKVLTDVGWKSIEDIVNFGIGSSVLSYNSSRDAQEWKLIVRRIAKTLAGNLIRIRHERGEIICTENHKIWTSNGYKRAEKIRAGDGLRFLQEDIHHPKQGEGDRQILRTRMRYKETHGNVEIQGSQPPDYEKDMANPRSQGKDFSHLQKISPSRDEALFDDCDLQVLSENFLYKEKGEDHGKVLHHVMLRQMALDNHGIQEKDSKIQSKEIRPPLPAEGVPDLSNGIHDYSRHAGEEVLQQELRIEIWPQLTRSQGEVAKSGQVSAASKNWRKKSSPSSKNESQQSNVDTRSQGQDDGVKQGENIPITRRERKANETPACAGEGVKLSTGMDGISNFIKGGTETLPVSSDKLQSGHSESRGDACDRSGWSVSQNEEMEIFRQTENGSVEVSRVVSVEVLKRGHHGERDFCGGQNQLVYNLEVEGNHNYYADGVLVSNCQLLANPTSARTKATLRIKPQLPIFLSGTPFNGRPIKLFAIANYLTQGSLGSYWDFGNKFAAGAKKEIPLGVFCPKCNVRRKTKKGGCFSCHTTDDAVSKFRKVVDFNGASNLDELKERLSTCMISRKKADVLKDLPPYRRVDRLIDLSPEFKQQYDAAMNDLVTYLMQHKHKTFEEALKSAYNEAMRRANVLRQLLSEAKVEAVVNDVEEVADTGKSSVVFACYVQTVKDIHAKLSASGVLATMHTGEMNNADRALAINSFKSGKGTALVCTLQSAGVGLNFTEAEYGLFVDQSWTPEERFQGESRLHRIGQLESVTYLRYFASGTYDEMIKDKVRTRQHVVDQVMGPSSDMSVEADASTGDLFEVLMKHLYDQIKKEN